MALINCKDCGNEISDSAGACPKCGAPVPRTIGEGETQCPHCMNIVDENATTCPGCRAIKGYMYDRRYGVGGKFAVITWAIIVPLALTIPFPIIGILTVPFALFAVYRLVTGPRWYQIQ